MTDHKVVNCSSSSSFDLVARQNSQTGVHILRRIRNEIDIIVPSQQINWHVGRMTKNVQFFAVERR